MFQTLGYFLELTISIYFFCVVMLFVINVCEFMPLTSHEASEEEKILIRTPSKAKATGSTGSALPATTTISTGLVHTEDDKDSKSKAARERWKSLPRKLPKPNTWDKVLSDPKFKEQMGEAATPGEESPEKSAQPDATTEQSPEATAGNQEPQEQPADDGPTAAPADDVATPADDGPTDAPADDVATPAQEGTAASPVDDVVTPAEEGPAADDGAQAAPADDGPAAPEKTEDADPTSNG